LGISDFGKTQDSLHAIACVLPKSEIPNPKSFAHAFEAKRGVEMMEKIFGVEGAWQGVRP